eukprot:PLAT4429.1.p1 GENE.PLAT4429.1~~PLAT4429.1.p1  ORF type:complete len:513 (-),score=214.74 PLAT4429.1:443-1981(-)
MDFLSALGLGGGGGGGGSSGSSFSGASFSGGSFSGSSGDVLPGELTRLDDRDDLIARLQRARPPERAVMNIAARAIQRQWMEHKHGIVRPRTPRASEPKWHEIAPEDITMLQKIGEGAYGIVYKGLWRGMLVAVKEIKVWAAEEMAEVEHEAALMSRVCNHDHVVNFVGVSTTAERLSIVTKFMSRMSCDDVLVKPGPGNMRATLSMAQLLRMAMDTAAGIMHLHREGVIHRDLACRNLLVDDHFRVRVADFGFSRTKEVTASKGYTHSAVGPIKWMAPEALRRKIYNERTDVFSFGVVLYEMFVGKPPWEGLENMDVVFRVCAGERMELPTELPPWLATVMSRCWKAEPTERPSMEQVRAELTRYHAAEVLGEEMGVPPPPHAPSLRGYDSFHPDSEETEAGTAEEEAEEEEDGTADEDEEEKAMLAALTASLTEEEENTESKRVDAVDDLLAAASATAADGASGESAYDSDDEGDYDSDVSGEGGAEAAMYDDFARPSAKNSWDTRGQYF